uniref:C-type lectin domain-containing protein n=1 Tax=Branchiostoma floridae TaxID=7739 RepID=C3ZH57_BRAFL|eukprot:XP_002592193.1 hypothetical protein BRAFLDRAFT_84619 [Branchiostoma floridae]
MGNWTYSKAFVLLYFAVMWPGPNVYGITKQEAAQLKTATDAVGLWPLNALYEASDITGNGNDGTATGTQLATGPYGDANGAFLFSGTAHSYIDIPNNGKLDVRYSFTILAHVYPTGEAGPIFDYVGTNPNIWHWALHFWQLLPEELQLRPVGRDGYFSPFVIARVLQLNAWNYVGCTYDSETGMASIWGNGELARELHIGVAEVASQHRVRVGAKNGGDRCFAGRIACLQLYDYAMTQEQIAAARDACKGSSTYGGAQEECRRQGGLVAIPRDEEEQLKLAFLKNCVSRDAQFWLGIRKTAGDWRDDRGTALGSFTSWASGEPDNGMDCAHIVFGDKEGERRDKWADANCLLQFRYVCEIEDGEWLERDPSWVVDSAGTPWVHKGWTFDAAKALDGNTGTYWNPQGTDRYYNNCWEDVVTVTNVQGGTDERQEFGGFQGTARYWRFLITETNGGYQPWLRELDFYGVDLNLKTKYGAISVNLVTNLCSHVIFVHS